MNIYIDSHIFQLQRFGGISRYFSTFLKPLYKKDFTKKNINIKLHTNVHSNQYISDLCVGYKIPFGKISILLGSISFHLKNEVIKNNSILFLSYYGRNLNRLKSRGIKLVSTIHDMIPEEGSLNNDFIDQKRKTLFSSTKIVSVSKTSAKKLISFYPSLKGKVSVIKNISYLPFTEESYYLTNALKDRKYLLAFSGVAKYKNLDLLIKTFDSSSLPNSGVELVIIGCGNNFKIENHIKALLLRINSKINFLIPTDSELKSLYKNALAVCSLSSNEGFSIPVIEALHLNKKLIISNIEVHKEIGGQFSNYVNIDSFESIVYAFNNLLDLKDPKNLLGNSYNEFLDYYSPKRFINEYTALFKKL